MKKKVKSISLLFFWFFVFQWQNAFAQFEQQKIEDIQAFCSNLKGFNLLGKFDKNWSNKGFKEKEFQIIDELGFNFVRLPVDYRTYTLTNNWNYFVDSWVQNIDDAIEWGQQYNIHVCLNLHSAPGYCVNTKSNLPAEQQRDLWTDAIAQNVFVNHWKFFAERYKNISPDKLSFNLVNEPNSEVSEVNYVAVMKKAINAIHEISSERLIFVDGLNYASDIITALKNEQNVAQAIHSYSPFRLTHYKAGWVNGSDSWAEPKWPILQINNHLYGTWKSELKSALVFLGDFAKGTEIIVNVGKVSIESTLQIKANFTNVFSKAFKCSAELGEDFTQIVSTQWGYQNISNKDYSVKLQNSTSRISFENAAGDWMTINYMSLVNDTDTSTYYLGDNSWGVKQATYQIHENGEIKGEDGTDRLPFIEYSDNIKIAGENNIPFMVQEFGVHNKTPHATTISFLNDLMDFFNENNVGWALWNLDGSFGILNSGRSDCNYKPFNAYQLDQQMLDVLLKTKQTSIVELNENKSINIFPNPAKNEVFINSKMLHGKSEIFIYNMHGKMVKKQIGQLKNNEDYKVDFEGLKNGLYLVSVKNNNGFFTEKILIKN